MSPGPAFLDSLAHLAGYISAVTRTTFIAPSGPYAVLSVLSALVLATAVLGHRRLRSRPRGRRRLRLGVLARAYFPRRFFRSASSQADMGLALFNVFLFGLLFGWALLSSQVISNHTGAGLAEPPMGAKISGVALKAGDRVLVETPGGGGYGPPAERSAEARERDERLGYVSADDARAAKPEGGA